MSERFWFFLSISCLRCLARSIRLGETGTNALCFGFFLYEWVYRLPRRAAPGDGTGELADRFGYSHRIRALFLTRSLAMILMNGLKALANPTRLRVLELLKTPAAFDGPHGADGRPIGVTAKALLRKLRCTQPTLHEQMQVLIDIGLVESRKVGRFVVYTRDEERIRQLRQTIIDQLLPDV